MVQKELAEAIEKSLKLSSSSSLTNMALDSFKHTVQKYVILLNHGRIPDEGWSEVEIEKFLLFISQMDSNNFHQNVGVGEREGRIVCPLVYRRHYGFAHGIGRSGNIAEIQPKAAGSAILYSLVNKMTRHAFLVAGFHKQAVGRCSLFPVATGMALALVFSTLKSQRPLAKYVIWLRVDQKSCLKAILMSGLVPIVVDNVLDGPHQVKSSIHNLENILTCTDPLSILCVVSCTSCFAPRAFDNVVDIGRVCGNFDVPHVVNNAYGVQCSRSVHLINEAVRLNCRLDVFVQSTDKNFMVPIGGSIIASPQPCMVQAVESVYPGRASSSQIIDMVATLLFLGVKGYESLLEERKENFKYFKSSLSSCNFNVLDTPHNDISMAIEMNDKTIGGLLFLKGVSGARLISPGGVKDVEGIEFKSFGAHLDDYPCQYLTVAAAIGMKQCEIDKFVAKLKKISGKGLEEK